MQTELKLAVGYACDAGSYGGYSLHRAAKRGLYKTVLLLLFFYHILRAWFEEPNQTRFRFTGYFLYPGRSDYVPGCVGQVSHSTVYLVTSIVMPFHDVKLLCHPAFAFKTPCFT